MIAYLEGAVLKIRPRRVVIKAGSVGYEVFVGQKILSKIQINEKIRLYIYTHQTSESTSLFGFEDESELNFFELLNSVNGVGPKTALDILGVSLPVIENIILTGDTKELAKIKGIGKKTAARIVLELKSKLTNSDPEVPIEQETNSEAITALMGLGWKKSELETVLAKIPPEIQSTEDIVRWFLQNK